MTLEKFRSLLEHAIEVAPVSPEQVDVVVWNGNECVFLGSFKEEATAEKHRQAVIDAMLQWLHDTVLGVYATKAPAVSRAQAVMFNDYPDEQFFERRQSGGGIRWHSHRISRLEVEPVEVRQAP